MKKMVLSKLSLACLLCGIAVSAEAAITIPYGWYLEGNAGTSQTNNVSYGNGTKVDSGGWAWNISAGYKFIPFFSLEIGYTNYADATAKYNDTTVGQDSHYGLDVAGKAMFPFGDSGFDVFAKLGAGRIHSQVSLKNAPYADANGIVIDTGTHTSTGLYFGFGGEYAFTPNLLGNFQWAKTNGTRTTGNLELYSIGLNYLFG